MDLALYLRVARRFWWLLLLGGLLAVLLAVMSMARITPHGLQYRQHEVWESQTVLLLTQAGFPWGRAVQDSGASSNLSQFGNLTELYSQFANSDAVKLAMRRDGAPKTWLINAAPDTSSPGLPVLTLSGLAYTAPTSVKAMLLGRKAFLAYVAAQQRAAAIPTRDRVVIQVLQNSTHPTLIQPRKKTLPIVVFLAISVLTVGLALVLENVRPRKPSVALAATAATSRTALIGGRRTSL